jgi:excisionase family DNA binding protein
MDLALFVLGGFLYLTGRFRFGGLRTQGRHVKAAGVVLMTPVVATFVLGLLLGMLFSDSPETLTNLLMFIAVLELIGAIVATIIAYILIADPQGAPALPGVLGKIQAERRQQEDPKPVRPGAPIRRHPLEQFRATQAPRKLEPDKKVLSVAEAALYMGVEPTQIMAWIDGGQLPAARDSSGFRIARSRLDELKGNQPSESA